MGALGSTGTDWWTAEAMLFWVGAARGAILSLLSSLSFLSFSFSFLLYVLILLFQAV